MEIKVEYTDGRKFVFNTKSKKHLSEIDKTRLALFLFNNGGIYAGRSDGEVDEDGEFVINSEKSSFGAAMPFNRLVAWVYADKKNKRYYGVDEIFNIGRGMFQVHEVDGRYWNKDTESGLCVDCCFRINKGEGACKRLACYPYERHDRKNVVFERI